MSQFAVSWNLSRQRFKDALDGLTQEQLNWHIHPGALSLGEMAIHVAGVEVSFAHQLAEEPLDAFADRLRAAATDGVVNDKPFPFGQEEISLPTVHRALDVSRGFLEPLMQAPSNDVLRKEIVSALGPMISGEGALARLAFHSAYHQGQAHLIKTSPAFPK